MKKRELGVWTTEHLKYLEVLSKSPKTIRTKGYHYRTFLGWTELRALNDIDDIEKKDVGQFQKYLASYRKSGGEKLGIDTQIAILSSVRSFFDWLESGGHINGNPCKALVMPKSPRNRKLPNRGLSDEQLEALLELPDLTKDLGLRDKALLHLVLSSGLRLDECARLRLFDLDMKERSIFVRKGKGSVQRVVYFSGEAKKWLETYLYEVRPKLANAVSGQGLFLSNRGNHMDTRTLGVHVKELFKKAGVDGYGACHRLRHTYTRILVKGGANIVSVKELLGHASLATTSRYANVHSDDTKNEYMKVSGF